MGNLVLYQRQNTSITSVIPNLIMLTKCKFHSGLREDILKLFKSYVYYISKHFFITRSELKRISKHTSLFGIEEVIFSYFLKSPHKKVNIMEILAAIITYSFQDFEAKVNLSINIFDFDGSKNLTEDEFFIMMRCFISGIAVMTSGVSTEREEIKKFVGMLYRNRTELRNNEIVVWIRQNPVLYDVFQINQPEFVKVPQLVRKKKMSADFRTFDNRDKGVVRRRMKSSYSVKRDDNFSVVIDSKIVTKSEIVMLKTRFDEICKSGLCSLKIILPILQNLGYKCDKIDAESQVLVSFSNILEILFKHATKNQLNRLLKFVGIKVAEERSQEREHTLKLKQIIEPKQVAAFRSIFNRYDVNHDGRVDLKELKNSLKNSICEETIEELYNQYLRDPKGLALSEFIKMYAPEGIEVPEDLENIGID